MIKIFELISYLNKPTKRKFVFIVFIIFINSILEFLTIGTIVPFISLVSNPKKVSEIELLKKISDFLNFQQPQEIFLFISFSFLIIIILSGFIKIFSIKIINDFDGTLKRELGGKLYEEILYKDYEFHLSTNSSQLINTQIRQLDASLNLIQNYMLLSLTALSILGITIALSIIDFRILSYIILLSFSFYFIATISTKKYIDKYGKTIFEANKSIVKVLQESLGFIRQIILDDSHNLFIKEYRKDINQLSLAVSRSSTVAQMPRYFMESLILSGLVISIMFMYLSGVDFYKYLTKGGAFILGLQKLLPLFQKAFASVSSIRRDKLNIYAVVELLKETKKNKKSSRNELINIFELKNSMRLEKISFSYKENKVLENINFEIKRGDVIGIVGKTGTGKSTFIDILLGLIRPDSGNIYINNKKMNANLFRKFRLSVSSVPQDYFLLDRSIEENIVFGKSKSESKIDYDLLKNVINISMLEDFVSSLPDGLKTFVGENGVRLSGGQKQRLAIARALYKDHSILILDEATSSVDTETEKKILQNIIINNPKITVIMIAHRLQTLENCDYILEIKNKKLIKYQNIGEYKSKYK